MFANQRTTGFSSIGAVAFVMAAWLVVSAFMFQALREGGQSRLPADVTCEVVCGHPGAKG